MKKCVSDKKYILLFLMSPEQEGDYKQRGELHIILRCPPGSPSLTTTLELSGTAPMDVLGKT